MLANPYLSTNTWLKFNLLLLAGFILTSLINLPLLPVFSILFWIVNIYFCIKCVKFNQESLVGLTIFLVSLAIVLPWFNDLYLAPSNDDSINHLGYLQQILGSNLSLLGKIDRPGVEYFGASKSHFYPTGSHALAAIWIYPWVKFFNFDWVALYKLVAITTLAAWPLALWLGSKIAFKNIAWPLRLFLVVCASTLPAFPLWPFGEGGLPRITALILITPLWFEALTNYKTSREGFIWAAVFAPVLLFVHPSILPFIALPLFFFPMRSIFGALLGAPLGALIFYALIHTGKQEVTDPNFIRGLLAPIRDSHSSIAHLWFDRLKGPFHYWFSDPYGFGKFLSPKNWAIYFAVVLAIKGRIPRRVLLLFVAPFVIAGISLIPFSLFDQLGLIFYHSVKRIGELTPLLGFSIALFAAHKIKLNRWVNVSILVLSLVFVVLFEVKSIPGLIHYHELYASPTHSKFDQIMKIVREKADQQIVIIDRHEFDVLRFALGGMVYTYKSECGETGTASDYCLQRKSWKTSLNASPSHPKIWWIPAIEDDAKETQHAIMNGKQAVELIPGAHLIEAF